MRPIKLTMTAFGPYKNTEVVDFNELDNRNLFLITGPTGSGKTTIFDAISFAIYGEASGGMRTVESLRSQFSDDKVLTEIELEFELKGIKYHMHRIPKQMRLKSAGVGFTEQKPEAVLTIFDGEPRTVIVGVRNVNVKMESVIGINSEQFKQIMMIPQGEFQKLLTSNSEERQKVLQQLFDTSIYNNIQMKLEMQAKSILGDIKKRKEIRDHEISKIEYLDQEELLELIQAEDKLVSRILELTKQQVETDKQKSKELEIDIAKLGKKIEQSIEQKQKAKENNEKLELREEIKGQLTEKELLSPEMNLLDKRVKRGERAQMIVAIEDNYNARKSESENKKNELERVKNEKIQAAIEAKETESIYSSEHSPEKQQERIGYVEELSKLHSYIKKVENIDTVSESIKDKKDLITRIKKNQVANVEFIMTSKKSLDELRKKSTLAIQAKVKASEMSIALDRVKDIEKRLNNLVNHIQTIKAESELVENHKQLLEKFKEVMKSNTEKYKRNNLDFLLNQAAVLAKDLGEGEACPVCGSIHHPKRAHFSANMISKEELDRLEQMVKSSESDFNKKNNEVGVLEEKINTLKKIYTDSMNELETIIGILTKPVQIRDFQILVNENTLTLSQLKSEKTELDKLASTYESIQENIKNISEEIVEAEENKNELAECLLKTSTDQSKMQSELENIYADVPEEVRTSIKLVDAIKVIEKMQSDSHLRFDKAQRAYEKAKERFVSVVASENQLIKEQKSSNERLEFSKNSLDSKIIESEFKDFEAYQSAKLTKEIISNYKVKIEEHSKTVHALKRQLEQLILQTKEIQIVDIAIYDEQIQILRQNSTDLSNNKGLAINRVNNNSKIVREVEMINLEIGDQEKVYEVIGNLSSIAKGNNKSRVTFERYVLAAFLEDIIAAANIRLSQMTGGRYTLSRTEELQRKNSKGGLELEVLDGFTGKSRHVKTLSGGEGFKASLSMALGLADVVQSYAGGVQLDTMFIDEGFGTLDQESLDSAISCLIELQKTGRLVGIISHVQELKERIDTRLEVSSSSAGSETRFIVG
jgi:exonuclease SbcC